MDDFEGSDIWKRDEVQSPCVKICVLHPDAKICIGCHRTAEEIRRWSRMETNERSALIAELPSRAPQLKNQRRGGRNRRQPT